MRSSVHDPKVCTSHVIYVRRAPRAALNNRLVRRIDIARLCRWTIIFLLSHLSPVSWLHLVKTPNQFIDLEALGSNPLLTDGWIGHGICSGLFARRTGFLCGRASFGSKMRPTLFPSLWYLALLPPGRVGTNQTLDDTHPSVKYSVDGDLSHLSGSGINCRNFRGFILSEASLVLKKLQSFTASHQTLWWLDDDSDLRCGQSNEVLSCA
ncbi:hypothetical protein DFH06DRAFT_689955 [Mycena polygramma]|nr:hypothetical protein DFH06DRAFT_689955 [Mycena polygramma]